MSNKLSTWMDYDKEALSLFEIGKFNEALKYGKKAIDLCDGSDEDLSRLASNLEFYEQSTKNKICLYTICRNESEFVDEWYEAHKTADKLVAVVHDCTDDTEEKLKSHGVIIEHDSIPDWRFDVGKNSALNAARKLAPDCNILIYASLDERFEPGWDIELRKAWTKDTDQANYKFVQARGPHGEDRLTTYFIWCHSNDPDWYYEYPVHEAIRYRNPNKQLKCISLFDKIKLIHYQDWTRPRNYQKLCEVRYKEHPDALSAIYLSRELCAYGRYEESIEVVKRHPIKDDSVDYMDFAYLYRILGDDYFNLGRYKESVAAYDQAHMICNEYNDPYIGMGRSYCHLGDYEAAYQVLKLGLRESRQTYSWAENPSFYEYEKYSWLIVACWNTGRKLEALAYAGIGYQKNPYESLAKTNLELCVNNITDMELGAI